MGNNIKGYCYLQLEYGEKKCKEQCEGCKEYERMLNDEVKRLDELYEDISTQINSKDVFALLDKSIKGDIEKATKSYSKNENEQKAFGDGINWLLKTLKNLTKLTGEKWTDD